MTDRDDFLSRWSRRKREAANEPAKAAHGAQDAVERAPAGKAPVGRQDAPDKPAGDAPDTGFDLSRLPSLDSIGPASDITAFLQRGVPAALSRAALRRAWAADPAIRDFIGLSENAWDFTAPDSIPGFGPLDPAEAKELFAQLLSETERVATAAGEAAASDPSPAAGDSPEAVPDHAVADSATTVSPDQTRSADVDPAQQTDTTDLVLHRNANSDELAAAQDDADAKRIEAPVRHRAHGRALPQ